MSNFPAPELAAGYVHNGQVVYALQFDLEAEPGLSRCLIVWLTSDGHSVAPWIQPDEQDRHIVTTKVGEHIKVRDKLEKVIGVSIYRASDLPQTTTPP
jgi:hypothetical protein